MLFLFFRFLFIGSSSVLLPGVGNDVVQFVEVQWASASCVVSVMKGQTRLFLNYMNISDGMVET